MRHALAGQSTADIAGGAYKARSRAGRASAKGRLSIYTPMPSIATFGQQRKSESGYRLSPAIAMPASNAAYEEMPGHAQRRVRGHTATPPTHAHEAGTSSPRY